VLVQVWPRGAAASRCSSRSAAAARLLLLLLLPPLAKQRLLHLAWRYWQPSMELLPA
jgi:hypothetical protein